MLHVLHHVIAISLGEVNKRFCQSRVSGESLIGDYSRQQQHRFDTDLHAGRSGAGTGAHGRMLDLLDLPGAFILSREVCAYV